jgi:hypothetical protein
MLVLLASLAGNFNPGWAVFAALAGGGAFLIVVYIGVITRITTMHYMYIWGSLFLPTASSAVDHTLGFLLHMSIISIGLGMLHVALLHALGVTSVGQTLAWELLFGTVQGAIFIAAIPALLAARRPPVRWGHINDPGFLMLGFGKVTALVVLAENLVFALLTGWIYVARVL